VCGINIAAEQWYVYPIFTVSKTVNHILTHGDFIDMTLVLYIPLESKL